MTGESQETIFSSILEPEPSADGRGGAGAGAAGAGAADRGEASGSGSGEQKSRVMEDLEALKQQNAVLQERLEAFGETGKVVDSLRNVFSPDETAKQREELRRRQDEYDADPIGYMDKALKKSVQELQSELEQTKLQAAAKEVIGEINQQYEVDWKKEPQIIEHLNSFSLEFRRSEPKKAMLRAIALAKAGKKRTSPPYYEGSSYGSDMMRRARDMSEAEQIAAGVKRFAKTPDKDPIKGILSRL